MLLSLFVTTIGTTPGNVLIAGAVDATRINLETLINAPATTTANGVALSTANQRLFSENFTATDSPSADTLTIVGKWVGTLEVSETLTDATDTFTAALEKQHNLFGRRGGITLVMQSDARPQVKQVPDKLWVNILNWVLYWVKTFADGAKETVNVEIASSAY